MICDFCKKDNVYDSYCQLTVKQEKVRATYIFCGKDCLLKFLKSQPKQEAKNGS